MLKLNPNDNQGIRYVLAGCLLRQDDYSALKELLAAHEDGSAFWLYTQALVAFRESGNSDEQAAALVEGTLFGAYSPGRWKSEDAGRAPERIVVGHADDPELREAVERAAIVAERANRSRDLSNMPPNELTPHTLGEKRRSSRASTSI